jgi:hypothetical protein
MRRIFVVRTVARLGLAGCESGAGGAADAVADAGDGGQVSRADAVVGWS